MMTSSASLILTQCLCCRLRYAESFGRKITMEIDTGAAVSVINQAIY